MLKKLIRYHWLFNRVDIKELQQPNKKDIENVIDDILNNVNYGIAEDENLFIRVSEYKNKFFLTEKQIGQEIIWFTSNQSEDPEYVKNNFKKAKLLYTYDVRNQRRI